MELKLNIYAKNDKGRYELEKTYMSEAVDIMFGTAEDLFGMLGDLDIKDNKELLNAVTKGFSRLKPFLKEIFIGVTDDELRRTKVKELIPLFVNIFSELFKWSGKCVSEKN